MNSMMPFNTPQKKWIPNRPAENSVTSPMINNSPRSLSRNRIPIQKYMNGSGSPMGMSCIRPKNVLTPNNISQGPLGFKQPQLSKPFMSMHNHYQQRHHLPNGSPLVAYSSLSYSQRDIHLENISPTPQRRLTRHNSSMMNGSAIKIPTACNETSLSVSLKRTHHDSSRVSGTPDSTKRQRIEMDRCSTSTTNQSSRSVTPAPEINVPPTSECFVTPPLVEIVKRPAENYHIDDQNNNRNNDDAPQKKRKKTIMPIYNGERNPIDASLSSSRRFKISQQRRRQKNEEMQIAKKKFVEINNIVKANDLPTNRVGFIDESLYNDDDEEMEVKKVDKKNENEMKQMQQNITSEDIEKRKASDTKRALLLLGIQPSISSTSTSQSVMSNSASQLSANTVTAAKSVQSPASAIKSFGFANTKPVVPSPLTLKTTLSGGTTTTSSTTSTVSGDAPIISSLTDSLSKNEKATISSTKQISPVKAVSGITTPTLSAKKIVSTSQSTIGTTTESVLGGFSFNAPTSTSTPSNANATTTAQFSFGAKPSVLPNLTSSINLSVSSPTSSTTSTPSIVKLGEAASIPIVASAKESPTTAAKSAPTSVVFSFGSKNVSTNQTDAKVGFPFSMPVKSESVTGTVPAAGGFSSMTKPVTTTQQPSAASFSFNSNVSNPLFGAKPAAAEVTKSAAVPVSAGFQIGLTPTSTPAAGKFNFGSTNQTTTSSSSPLTNGFSFGAKPKTPAEAPSSFGAKVTTPAFTFGAATTTTPTTSGSTTASTFAFAKTDTPSMFDPKTAAPTTKSSLFSSSSMPSFGVAAKTPATQTTPSFAFGAKTVEDAPKGFSFNAPSKNQVATNAFNATVPAFGTAPATTTAAAKPFSFAASAGKTPFGPQVTTQSGSTSTPPSLFGSSSTPTFGAPAATSKPAFGATGVPVFGATPAAAAPPAFGATPAAAPPAFGATPAAKPAFGATPTAVFGATPAAKSVFGATPTAVPAFGAAPTAVPSFGATPTATPAFGAAPTSVPTFGATPTAATAFGAKPSAIPAFGAAPTAIPSFGAAPTATPTFGATPTATPAFGATPAAASAFGAAPTATPAFGAAPTAAGFNFSAAAAGSSSFNFGAGNSASPTPATAFGSKATPTFGAGATPTPTFGAGATPTPTFGAGATPTFGSGAPPPAFGTTNMQGRVTRKARRRR